MQRGLSSPSPSRRRLRSHILLFSISSLSLSTLTNSYPRDEFRGRHKKRERTRGNLPSCAGILVPFQSPSAPAGCAAAARIRRPRAIDSISRPSVIVSPVRPRSKDPTCLGLFASPFVGAPLDSGAVHAWRRC